MRGDRGRRMASGAASNAACINLRLLAISAYSLTGDVAGRCRINRE